MWFSPSSLWLVLDREYLGNLGTGTVDKEYDDDDEREYQYEFCCDDDGDGDDGYLLLVEHLEFGRLKT